MYLPTAAGKPTMFWTRLAGFSGSTNVVRIPFLAKLWESFNELVFPKVLRQGMALPMPHIEIYSLVIASISVGMT